MHNRRDAGPIVAAIPQQVGDPLEVSDGIEVEWTLLSAVAAIEVSADCGVRSITGQLADPVDLIDERFQADHPRLRLAADPTWVEHPGVHGRSDDASRSIRARIISSESCRSPGT